MKISQINCPLLFTLNMEPFLFFNAVYARNSKSKVAGGQDSKGSNIRASTGFGLSWQISPVAIEAYYTLATKKQTGEIQSSF